MTSHRTEPTRAAVTGAVAFGLALVGLTLGPAIAVALLVGIVLVLGTIEDPAFGAIAIAGFVILHIPEIATDFHGAPSTFAPLLGLVALSIVARSVRTGEWPAGAARPAAVVVVFIGVALLSLLAAGQVGAGLDAVVEVTKDAAVAIVIALLVRSVASLRLVVWVLLAGGLLLAGLTVLQFVTGAYGSALGGLARSEVHQIFGVLDDARASGPLEDANFYAQWMVMLVPLAIDRFHDEVETTPRLVALGAGLAASAAIVITFSRGGLLALVVVVSLMALRHPPRMSTVVAVLAIGLLSVPFLPEGYTERMLELADIGQTEIGTDPSIRAREAEAIAATDMFLDHPVTGIGYGTYLENYEAYVRSIGIEQTAKPREAHNLYLEVAAEMGIVGIAMAAGIAGATVIALRTGRHSLRARGDHSGDGMGYAIGVSLIGYLVTSTFLHMAFSRPMWLLLGLALALPSIAHADRRARDRAMEAA